MSTNFPTSLDNFTNPTAADDLVDAVGGRTHPEQHADLNDAVEAIQAKVGITGSAVATSHDKRIAVLEAAVGGAVDYSRVFTQAGVITTHLRDLVSSGQGISSTLPMISGFIAPKTFTANNISYHVNSGTGTATIGYAAIYSVASNGDLTLVATSANTTTMYNATGWKTVALATPAALTGGNAYAVYLNCQGAFTPQIAALPSLVSSAVGTNQKRPFIIARAAADTGAPDASITYASLTIITGGGMYFELS